MTQATVEKTIAQATATTTKLIGLVRKMDVAVEEMTVSRQALGNFMIATIGSSPTFEHYEAIRVNFCAHWSAKDGSPVSDEAKRQAWSRAWGTMNGVLAAMASEQIAIPKATSTEAVKKAADREKITAEANAKLVSIPSGDKKAEQKVRESLGKIVASSSAPKAEKAIARKALDILDTKARDAVKAQTSEMVKAIRGELSNATPSQLKQIADILGIQK